MSVVISYCGTAEASVATNHGGFKLRWFVMVAGSKEQIILRATVATGRWKECFKGKAFKTLTISSSVGTSVDKSEEVTAKTGIKKITHYPDLLVRQSRLL